MVYGGKPSTGCYLCRRRKIKCDEAFPECRNCVIYGKPCPGYRQDAIFRNETEKIQKLVKRSSTSASTSTGTSTSSGSPPHEQNSPASTTGASQIVPSSGNVDSGFNAPLSLSLYQVADSTWEDRAVCYFFDQYTTFGGELGTGDCVNHLQCLPSLYALCRESERADSSSSCLRWAVDATALVTMGNEAKVPGLAVKARQSYGMALRGLREALQTRSQAVQDETFAAVVLLSLFEDITGERNGLSSSHTAGFELLMKLRGESQLGNQLGRDLFSYAYAHTHIEILALGDKPRYNTEWITGLLDSSDPVHQLIVTASKLSELFIQATSTPPVAPSDYPAIVAIMLECCKLLDMEIAQWPHNLPDYWLPLHVDSPQGDSLITYQRIPMAAIWNYYRAVRIVLQRMILELNHTLAALTGTPDSHHEGASAIAVIQEMITDICRTIPFSLGDVDSRGIPNRSLEGKPQIRAFHGYTLVFPLWYVLASGLGTAEQTQLIRSVLARVGSALGIRLALILAETPEGQYAGAEERIRNSIPVLRHCL